MERNDFVPPAGCFSVEKLNPNEEYVVINQCVNHVFFLTRLLFGESVPTSKCKTNMAQQENQMASQAKYVQEIA